jgi:hypothetical protein
VAVRRIGAHVRRTCTDRGDAIADPSNIMLHKVLI